MAVKIDTGKALASLNLTPLIDVVFLLLIFFLVATKFAEEERELDIPLPEASEARPLIIEPAEIFVNINASGEYIISGQKLTLRELEATLLKAWHADPERVSVVIRADRRCAWEVVVSAINACLRANIRNYRASTWEGEGGSKT
ncbi:MAG: biopolymer transporter ExbD [Thermoguttaceae bacterium]|nr:biopolymer transporter ExbD [Thermoguttaceae bacterium]MDW8078570.1 biopolymer transporter ExbD [Thermoguttaceae bacterium]